MPSSPSEAVRDDVATVAKRTPVLTNRTFSERLDAPVLLTAENLQRTGSFKVRGAAAEAERARVLATPLHCARQSAGLWLGAAVLFSTLNLTNGPTDALHVGCTILLGGITTCAIAYLLVERIARPVTAIALAKDPVLMAGAMKKAVEAGREAFRAGRMPRKFYAASPSSPTTGLIA